MANQKNSSRPQQKAEKTKKALAEEIEAIKAKFKETEAELEQARAALEEMTDLSTELQKEVDELKKENDRLANRLRSAEENASKQAEAAKREVREAERQRTQFERQIQQLQATVAALEQKLDSIEHREELPAEDVSAPKSSFRIDLYPREGHHHGRIEHTLTKDKRAFSGVDQVAITEFIASHLPKLGEVTEEPRPKAVPSAPGTPTAEETLARPEIEVATAEPRPAEAEEEILSIVAVQAFQPTDATYPTRTLASTEDFAVETTFRLSGPEGLRLTQERAPFRVAWYVHKLAGGGRSEPLVTVEDELSPDKQEYSIRAEAPKPAPGMYRLMSVVNFPTARNLIAYREERLLHVQ